MVLILDVRCFPLGRCLNFVDVSLLPRSKSQGKLISRLCGLTMHSLSLILVPSFGSKFARSMVCVCLGGGGGEGEEGGLYTNFQTTCPFFFIQAAVISACLFLD